MGSKFLGPRSSVMDTKILAKISFYFFMFCCLVVGLMSPMAWAQSSTSPYLFYRAGILRYQQSTCSAAFQRNLGINKQSVSPLVVAVKKGLYPRRGSIINNGGRDIASRLFSLASYTEQSPANGLQLHLKSDMLAYTVLGNAPQKNCSIVADVIVDRAFDVTRLRNAVVGHLRFFCQGPGLTPGIVCTTDYYGQLVKDTSHLPAVR